MEYALTAIAAVLLIVSVWKDRAKTLKALKIAGRRLGKLSGMLLALVLLVSIAFFLVPPEKVADYLGRGGRFAASGIAALIGSIAVMPGFVAFPLGGMLRESGVPYMVIAAFTGTLMMVGVVSLPVEQKYLGLRVAIIRNLVAFFTALAVALITGLLYGELF